MCFAPNNKAPKNFRRPKIERAPVISETLILDGVRRYSGPSEDELEHEKVQAQIVQLEKLKKENIG